TPPRFTPLQRTVLVILTLALTLPFALVGPRARPAAANTTILDLGVLNGPEWAESAAFGINSLDQVVGSAQIDVDGFLQEHAFVWTSGTMTDLGTLGGSSSGAEAINDGGQIVGFADT